MTASRLVGVALLIVVGLVAPADARGRGGVVVINTGDAIIHIKDLPKELALESQALDGPVAGGAPHSFGKLGYRHELFGIFWFDLWRWGGEYVIYDGDTYIPISDEVAEGLGGSVPWRYHLPDGLLLLSAIGYFALIGRRRRAVRTTLYIAGFMLVLAIAFYFMGLTWEFGIPLVIALHHGIAARAAMHAAPEDEEDDAEAVAAPPAPEPRPSRPLSAPPLPSQPLPPLVVERPPAPVVVPMRADDRSDGPKLLR